DRNMRRNGLTAIAVLGCVTLFCAPGAFATAELKLDDGLGNSVDIKDGDLLDSCLASNCVTFNGVLGDWNINVSTGTDKNASAPASMDLNSVNHHNASVNASTMTITLSDTGFTPIFPGFKLDVGG